jgi:pantetheine-phosphate adenylyltransferase
MPKQTDISNNATTKTMNHMRKALFPGTFDPITIGHLDIIDRSLSLFDKLIIGIGRNANKAPMFSEEVRLNWIKEIYKGNQKVDAVLYDGLTITACEDVGANFILRGIRYVNDFEYEKAIADMNRTLDKNIETVFLTCLPQYTSVASTLVRDVLRNGGDVSPFLPEIVTRSIQSKK